MAQPVADAARNDDRHHSGLPAMKWLIMYSALSGWVYGTCRDVCNTSASMVEASECAQATTRRAYNCL